jgi:lysozyme
MNLEAFRKHLEQVEGRRSSVYFDSMGVATIGVGHNLKRPISDRVIDMILEDDMADAIREAEKLPYWHELNDVRQLVVADLVFNLGLRGWLGFVRANEAMVRQDYETAAKELLASKWALQVGSRAGKLVAAMRSGVWP